MVATTLFAFPSIRGKKRKDTVLICLSSDDVEEGKIQMNRGSFSPFLSFLLLFFPFFLPIGLNVIPITSPPPPLLTPPPFHLIGFDTF